VVTRLQVSIGGQWLRLLAPDGRSEAEYRVSTAATGAGEQKGSGCTPRGRHRIRAKIGAGQPLGAVFRARRPTGEVWTPAYAAAHPGRDWILTRILWLGGLQAHFNRYGDCDSAWRYIYIHGTPDTEPMGVPRSHGCIRMRNNELVELFERVRVGDEVLIEA